MYQDFSQSAAHLILANYCKRAQKGETCYHWKQQLRHIYARRPIKQSQPDNWIDQNHKPIVAGPSGEIAQPLLQGASYAGNGNSANDGVILKSFTGK